MPDAELVIHGTVLTEQIADLDVCATFLAGRRVYAKRLTRSQLGPGE